MDGIIAISQFVKDFTTEDLQIPPDAIDVIHNCSDVGLYQRPADVLSVRGALEIDPSAPIAILVGELTGRKGVLEFIEAARVAHASVPAARFLLAGRGDLEQAARRRVAELGLDDAVRFLGWRSDVPDLLRASDLLAVTSLKEGFGRTITEAMSSGLPVVSFDSGAPREIIADGETGILVPDRDPTAFGEAMISVLSNPARRKAMGEAGLALARARFDVPIFLGATEALLTRVLQRAGR